MSNEFTLNAEVRTTKGKGASRRLRREHKKVPAILYGGDKDPQNIQVLQKELVKALENEAFYSHILTLVVDGQNESAVLKDIQRHPSKGFPQHVDFMRVVAGHEIHMQVPLHYVNEEKCVGAKLQGGRIQHNLTEIEVVCLPKDLPEYIEVDVAELNVGDSLHLTDLKLPAGVELAELRQGEDHDLAVVNIQAPKGGSDADEEEGEGEEGGEEA